MGRNLFSRNKKTKSPSQSEAASSSSSSNSSPLSSAAPIAASPSFVRRVQNTDDLRQVFGKFDANGDGKISLSELEEMLRSLGGAGLPGEAEGMMREADLDGDGFISLEEFISVNSTAEADSDACLEDLRNAFTVYDRDGNGLISAEELHHVLRSMGEKASLAACKSMIRSVDQNGDGAVNFEEFLHMMTRSARPHA